MFEESNIIFQINSKIERNVPFSVINKILYVIVCAKLGGSSNLQLDLVFGDTAQQKHIATLYHECMKKRMTVLEEIEDCTTSLPGAFVPGPQASAAASAAVGAGSTL